MSHSYDVLLNWRCNLTGVAERGSGHELVIWRWFATAKTVTRRRGIEFDQEFARRRDRAAYP